MSDPSQSKISPDQGSAPSPVKKRDRGASEERLLSAGREVFSKVGFSGATTKMIAKKADVNESLIARYFDGKEGLLVAIVQSFIEDMMAHDLVYSPQETLAEELREYVRERVSIGCDHEDFVKILISQALVDRKFKKKIRDTVPMQMDKNLIARVQRLADLGKLKNTASVFDICQDVDTYMDGIFFLGKLIHEENEKDLLERTERFVTTYAKLYDK